MAVVVVRKAGGDRPLKGKNPEQPRAAGAASAGRRRTADDRSAKAGRVVAVRGAGPRLNQPRPVVGRKREARGRAAHILEDGRATRMPEDIYTGLKAMVDAHEASKE